uniref:Uncharacterized protein n=1 Tax=Buteo japonicus TaxID=224669 RepID=A0A8C0BUQ5_9AVES
MLALAWTSAQHSTLQPVTPGLKRSGGLRLPGSWDCRHVPLCPENSMPTASWAALGGRSCGVSILGDIQNSTGHSPGQPALADPA